MNSLSGWLSVACILGVLAAFTSSTLGESPPIAGQIEKTAGGPTLVRVAGRQPQPAAAFSTIVIEPRAAPAAVPRLPFTIHWRTGEQLAARTFAYAERCRLEGELGMLEVPAEHVEAVARHPASPEILREPFDRLPEAWTLAGQPRLDNQRFVSAPAALLLSQPGQRLERRFDTPIPEGTISLRYYDDGLTHPGRGWSVALVFQGAPAPLVAVKPGWDRPFVSAALDKSLSMATLAAPRRHGWRELEIAFGPGHLSVAVDGAAVVSSLGRGVPHPLVGVTLQVDNAAEGAPDEPADVAIDDVVVRGAEVRFARLLYDAALCSVVDAAGDQWFGTVSSANQESVKLRLAGDYEHRFDWRTIVRLELAIPSTPTAVQWSGSIGVLELASGSRLIVALRTADADRWIVHHPLLGERQIAVPMVRSWTPWLVGSRTQLHAGPIHLGAKTDFAFRSPVPVGSRFKTHFELAGSVKDVYLTVRATGMERISPLAPFAASVRAGHLQTRVWLNGRPVDYLNRHLPDRPDPVDLRVLLPPKALRIGSNELEIRLTPDPKTGAVDEVELAHLAVEQLGTVGP